MTLWLGFVAFCLVALVICAITEIIGWYQRRPRIPRLYACAHQDAIDALTLKRYRTALARNAKAVKAENDMRRWHAGYEGGAKVIPIRRRMR